MSSTAKVAATKPQNVRGGSDPPSVERCSEGLHALALQLHAGGCAVTPVAHEMLSTRGKPSQEVIAFDTAARSTRALAFE